MKTMLKFLLAITLCAAPLAGCGGSLRASLVDDAAKAPTADERITELRITYQRVSSHPRAGEWSEALLRARTWLERAEKMVAGPKQDAARRSVLLDAAQGQLVVIMTTYNRLLAQARVDAITRGEP